MSTISEERSTEFTAMWNFDLLRAMELVFVKIKDPNSTASQSLLFRIRYQFSDSLKIFWPFLFNFKYDSD